MGLGVGDYRRRHFMSLRRGLFSFSGLGSQHRTEPLTTAPLVKVTDRVFQSALFEIWWFSAFALRRCGFFFLFFS